MIDGTELIVFLFYICLLIENPGSSLQSSQFTVFGIRILPSNVCAVDPDFACCDIQIELESSE